MDNPINNPLKKPTDYTYKKAEIAEGRYIRIHKAPPGAIITLFIGNTNSTGIDLQEGAVLRNKDITTFFFSSDTIYPDDEIEFQVSAEYDFKIELPPVIKDVNEIANLALLSNMSPALLALIDKIVNPYIHDGEYTDDNGIITGATTVLNTTLDCDKIDISLNMYRTSTTLYDSFDGGVMALINDKVVALVKWQNGRQTCNNHNKIIENCKGKALKVIHSGSNTVDRSHYYIQKYNLKA